MLTICLPQISPDDVAVIFGIPCACAVVVRIIGLLPITRQLMTGEMTDKQLRAYMAKEDAMWRAKSDKFEHWIEFDIPLPATIEGKISTEDGAP